ncbi:MAG TPA: hypothetical protein G4N96_06330 [Chloroflexi bacterium]|nr:hypothetical protein [Chloroflexota bacterium]
MRILAIFLAVLIGLVGLRLLLAALKAVIMFFKVEQIPVQAKQTLFRDLVLGVLFLILAFAIIT